MSRFVVIPVNLYLYLTYYILLLFILWPLFSIVTNTLFVISQISILLPYQIPYWNRLSLGFLSFWRCKGSTVCAHSKVFLRFFPLFYLFLDMRQSTGFHEIWLFNWSFASPNFFFVVQEFRNCRSSDNSPNSHRQAQWSFVVVMSELLNFCNFWTPLNLRKLSYYDFLFFDNQ